MDLQNLENYPVYILNVIPEVTEESNVQQPQQMTSGELLSYNFYVPNVDHQVPILNAESVPPIVSHTNTTKSIKKLTFDKTIHHSAVKNNQSIESHINTNSEKSDLSRLIKDEDIHNGNNKIMKYDPATDTNVIIHLVRPTDLEPNCNEIKVPKRGRPRKVIGELSESETKRDESSIQNKAEDIIEYPLISTKSGRLCKPPKHFLNGENAMETKKNQFLEVGNNDFIGRKKVKYSVKSDFVCGGCGKTYLGHKRMQEHFERFPTHKMNTDEKQVDSELQDIFQNLNETPINIDVIYSKKETHTQTEVLKNQHCAYIKSKKNLQFHLKQIMKHLKKTNLIKSLSGTISVWDLLSSILENDGLQGFTKELNTLIINLRNLSKSLKFVSNCESNSIDNSQMFIDDSLGQLFGLPKGSYCLKDIQNNYEMQQESNVWAIDSTKSIEPEVSVSQNLNRHSSPIHLNLFDSQSSKVDFLLSSSMEESILCDENQAVLESVDGLVSERLRTMSDHLHSNVPIIDYPIASTSSASNVSQPDSFMGHGVYEVFTNDLNLVPTSTEEFIKSLEQFEPLNDSDNALSTETRMLDFEDLQHTFHTS
ncbi:uncharacterized protein LOC114124648 [Aphis gossypii]|uniref:Uncharacterized protein n=1 Tax=Aphis gossypii TaxID=80765 RepID=A0A9P0NDV9_APHGO|nr:uncharacterized protein LOC114124648 [Aphis gossypii]XP_050054540.1 uncharacterized protein LOC114124648 [Aphis gossypii]CAH1709762.1 unnamed protein product [Aphis gossypii]